MSTVLLTAAGSAAAAPVMESLRAQGHRVVACDIYPRHWNYACTQADDFFQAEMASNAEPYAAQMLGAVREYSLDFVFPLTDVEVDALCSRKADFSALGCTLCAPDEPAARLCRDKALMAEAVRDICDVIPTYNACEYKPREGDFPVMLKPLRGRSSEGQLVARNAEAYRAALGMRGDYIAQPFISGDVITVDIVRDAFGGTAALARRELLRTKNGLGTTVRTMPGHPLAEVCGRTAERAGIVGAVNMEFIEHGDRYYFLEANPRFSGGVGFSMLAGFDVAGLALAAYTGGRVGAAGGFGALTLTRNIELVITQDD